MAFGLGPLLITYLVGWFGLSASPVAILFGLFVMVYPFKVVPCPEEEGLKDLGFMGSMKEVLGKVWKPVALIWMISVLRSFVSQAYGTFLPVLCARDGFSLPFIGHDPITKPGICSLAVGSYRQALCSPRDNDDN